MTGRPRSAVALQKLTAALVLLFVGTTGLQARESEPWIPEPLPPGFRVEATEFDGPVFADARGKTLYRWPYRTMRNGVTGDVKNDSSCTDQKAVDTAGLMSPYPGGLELPDLASRPACTEAWPPALAPAQAKAVGKWSVIERQDGRRQWAYDGAALYTSVLDERPGDLFGGDSYDQRGDAPAVREPIGPVADIPPGFGITTTWRGRLLHTARGFSVYASDADRRGRSACDGECARQWIPMQAPVSARVHGAWGIVERSDGSRQWSFRGKPLYRYAGDDRVRSLLGSDEPGWHNVYTQLAPEPPASFTVQVTSSGEVLADAAGRTIYTYFCGDDAPDQLGCDHPSETQAYRLAICGGGSMERCLQNFPYVVAARGERSRNRMWRIREIDPASGRFAASGQAGALRVWAFRDRPVYTFAGDSRPGEVNADGLGEFQAERTGYRAIWLRDDFFRIGG